MRDDGLSIVEQVTGGSLAGHHLKKEDRAMIDMGEMALADYAYLIGLLGLVCGLVFVLGLRQ